MQANIFESARSAPEQINFLTSIGLPTAADKRIQTPSVFASKDFRIQKKNNHQLFTPWM